MEQDQRIQMSEQIRHERSVGRPEVAQQIQKALDRDEFLSDKVDTVDEPVETVFVDAPKKNASKATWQQFAKNNSDFDHELIDGITRKDLQAMLIAHGIIAKFDK